jgi:hypothetical protein
MITDEKYFTKNLNRGQVLKVDRMRLFWFDRYEMIFSDISCLGYNISGRLSIVLMILIVEWRRVRI